jgi:hypothetical protein
MLYDGVWVRVRVRGYGFVRVCKCRRLVGRERGGGARTLVSVLVRVSLCVFGLVWLLLFSFLGVVPVPEAVLASWYFFPCELLAAFFSPSSCFSSSSSRSSSVVLHDSKYLLMRFSQSFSFSARGIHSLKRRS